MEVAIPLNDSQNIPSAVQQHRHSRYSTPEISNARSPHHSDPTTALPITSSQEPLASDFPDHSQSHTQASASRLVPAMDVEGQNHDRMETDDASETSGLGEGSRQHHERAAGEHPTELPVVLDAEAMDTTPDHPEPEEVRQLSNPRPNDQGSIDSQDVNGETSVNHNLVRSNSRGSTVLSRSPTPAPANGTDPSDPVMPAPAAEQASEAVVEDQVEVPAQSQTPPAQTIPDAPPPAEQEEERSGGQNRDSPDEDSEDEEEHPYWANFEADTSSPSEDELKIIEQDSPELSAQNHEHWKTLTYEPLDDPEYIPTGEGRIEWTLKGYHGTPDKPNKEIVMRSPSIQIGGYYWNIKLYPRGNENTDLMSVYVECSMTPYEADKKASEKGAADPDSTAEPATTMVTEPNASQPDQNSESPAITSAVATDDIQQPQHSEENESSSRNVDMEDVSEEPSWEVPAQVLCIAYNPEEPRVYAYQKVTHRYHKETSDWGWTRFHGPWDRLHKRERFQRRAMLQNDTLSFTAYIRTVKDDTGALWWHSPSHSPEWDSFERLGLNRLWVGSPESSAVLCALSTWLHLTPLCPSIKAANYLDQDRTGKDRARPLFEELEQIRHHHSMPLKNTDPEAFSLVNVAEMLDWNDAGNCEPDVVSNLDILRRTLSCEALGVKQVRDSTDIFDDILFIRQPSNVPIDMFNGNQSISSKSDAPNSPKQAPSSVQQTLSTVPASTLQLKDPSEPPAILQIELHRQEFDVNARKWRKLTHRIGIDQSVTLDLQGSPATHYTLFSMAIHCGDLESKDYYSVIRPQGPGTRWIKYSGDKSSRGVECLTTKQAIEAHEGSDEKTADVDAVAYLVTYVRTNLLSRLSSEPIASNTAASQTGSPEEDTQKPENEERVPVYVYESSSLKHHIGLGIADWDLREGDKNQLLRLEVPESTTLGDLVDSIDSAWTSARNGVSGKYALWFLDTVKGNPAMRNVVRAPEIIPLSLRGLDAKLKDSHNFDKVCRILLDDDTPEVPEPSDIQPPPPDNPATDESNPEDSMQVDGDEAEHSDDTAAPAEDGQEPSTGTRTAGPEEPRTENGDTLMEGNPDPDAISGTIQPTASRQWNANLNTKALGSFDDIFVFLKVFDAEEQSLKGVTTFWVKGNEKVGYTIRKAMSWDDDVPIEVYQEQSLSTLEEVRSGSTYQDVAGLQNYIMVVQRTPNDKERSRLEAAGKPTTILGHFSYQCSACDPAYLQPHLTRSYFASPYFSGDIAYGRAHGKGTLITTLGDAYTGGFISGSKSGHGKMRFANGDTYTGSWANDDPNGHGEMVYAKTGNVYTGGFRKRKRHGKGVMKFEVADEEEHLCGICYEEEMDCCFYDCGHVAACEGCARQVDVCPVCRRGVKAVVRIWRS